MIPISRRNRVVFPAPLGPRRPQICPRVMWKVTSTNACLSPNVFLTFSTATMFDDERVFADISFTMAPRRCRLSHRSVPGTEILLETSRRTKRGTGCRRAGRPLMRWTNHFHASTVSQDYPQHLVKQRMSAGKSAPLLRRSNLQFSCPCRRRTSERSCRNPSQRQVRVWICRIIGSVARVGNASAVRWAPERLSPSER